MSFQKSIHTFLFQFFNSDILCVKQLDLRYLQLLNDTRLKFATQTLHSFSSFLNCFIDYINLIIFLLCTILIQFLFKSKFFVELINLSLQHFVSFSDSAKFEALRSLNYFDSSDYVLDCCRHLLLQLSSFCLLEQLISFFQFGLLSSLSCTLHSSHI